MRWLRRRPEIHLFVLWSEARHEERRVLDDLTRRFIVLDVVEVVWTVGDTFALNLTRMYGHALPPRSDKELHCGSGPFLAVIVWDPSPRYRMRRTNRGYKWLNSTVFDARHRYRTWTGGGYRVHATDSVAETQRNLVLLFGRPAQDFAGRHPWSGTITRCVADPVGTDEWDSIETLLLALRAYGAVAVPGPHFPSLAVLAEDVWWAEYIAGGQERGPGIRMIRVNGSPLDLTILQGPTSRRAAVRGQARRIGKAARSFVRDSGS